MARTLARVRPGRTAQEWVRRSVAELKGDDALANQLGRQGATDLEAALPAVSIRPDAVVFVPATRALPADGAPSVAIIRAPDPAEEVREVVRAIARDLNAPVPAPLRQIAVLYRQTDPYGPLVRDSLTLAGFPWSALEGRTLAESRPGAALLGLLGVRERDFAREAVLGWIDAAPVAQAGLAGSAWDRLSRAANVVRGAPQWLDRLDNFLARQREPGDQREAEENAPAASALRHEADLAKSMRTTVAALAHRLQPPSDGSAWGELVTWTEGLWTQLCGGINAWPESEQPFVSDISRALESDTAPIRRGQGSPDPSGHLHCRPRVQRR